MLKKWEFECSCSTERIEAIAIQCTFVMSMSIPREKNPRSVIVFSNVFGNFLSRNNALCDLSKVCQLQEQRVSEASDPYRFLKSPKRIRQKSLGRLPKTE